MWGTLIISAPDHFSGQRPSHFFSIRHCVALTDNCAVVRRGSQTKLASLFSPTNRDFFWWYLITSAVFIFCTINKNRATVLKTIQYFLLFAIINIPQKYIKKHICFLSLGRYVFFYLFLVNKNRNKHLSIGLRKIYSVYKIGDSFMAFLLIIYFFTSNGSGQRYFFVTATLWRTLWKILTHFWDRCHFHSKKCI